MFNIFKKKKKAHIVESCFNEEGSWVDDILIKGDKFIIIKSQANYDLYLKHGNVELLFI
jgi:hypothetical protein